MKKMDNNRTNIEDLFRQSANQMKVSPPESVWDKVENGVESSRFISSGVRKYLNIAASLGPILVATVFLISVIRSPQNEPISNITEIEERIDFYEYYKDFVRSEDYTRLEGNYKDLR